MSVHKNRWGTYDVRYRTHEGKNKSKSFRERADAEEFDAQMKRVKEQAKAMAALREAVGPEGQVLGQTDEERYDRDFEAILKTGSALCFIPDPNWRGAMRKRARAAGITLRTQNLTDERYSKSVFMAAYNPDFKSTRSGPDPDWAKHRGAAHRDRDEWERRGHLGVVK